MYWFLTWLWSIGGTALIWNLLSMRWDEIDLLEQYFIKSARTFHRTPGMDGYMDLKYSALRRSIVFVVSSAIIYWFDSLFMWMLVSIVNLAYCWLSRFVYKERKAEVEKVARESETEDYARLLAIPVTDSHLVVLYTYGCYGMLVALMLFSVL